MVSPRDKQVVPDGMVFVVTCLATVLAYTTLYLGAKAIDFEPNLLADPTNFLRLADLDRAEVIRLQYLVDIFGYYLLYVPLFVYTWVKLHERDAYFAGLGAVCGLMYALTGALGAGIMSTALPELMRSYLQPSQDPLLKQIAGQQFLLVYETIDIGWWHRVEMIPISIWFYAVSKLMWPDRKALATAGILITIMALLSSLGTMFDATNSSAATSYQIYLVLQPVWMVWLASVELVSPSRRE